VFRSLLQRVVFVAFFASNAVSAGDVILMQSTTSVQNSGLFDYLLPLFQDETGIEVRVVAVGTGQALRNAVRGDADLLFVHSKEAEEDFVARGFGLARYEVMYNDFIIVGPSSDPAKIGGLSDVTEALRKISDQREIFVSRGDDSGTHRVEMTLWGSTDIRPERASGAWYRETGSGMGATLNIAIGMGAYVLADRASWIAFGSKRDHIPLVEGDPRLMNQYSVIAVNPLKHTHVNVHGARQFIDWILSDAGQRAIAAYTMYGQQLFVPNARSD